MNWFDSRVHFKIDSWLEEAEASNPSFGHIRVDVFEAVGGGPAAELPLSCLRRWVAN